MSYDNGARRGQGVLSFQGFDTKSHSLVILFFFLGIILFLFFFITNFIKIRVLLLFLVLSQLLNSFKVNYYKGRLNTKK